MRRPNWNLFWDAIAGLADDLVTIFTLGAVSTYFKTHRRISRIEPPETPEVET